MAGTLIAERILEPEAEDARAGGPARYALYAAAAVAAMTGAWLIAEPASRPAPTAVEAPMATMTVAAPTDAVRQIDMSARSTPVADTAPTVAAAPAEASAPVAEAALPPLPQRRPAVPQATASAQPAATVPVEAVRRPAPPQAVAAAQPAEPVEATPRVLGAPPQEWTMVERTEPVYVPAQPDYDTAAAVAVEDGPVPPMPVDPAAAGEPRDGIVARSERAVGSAWNWSTGTVTGIVREVRSRTF